MERTANQHRLSAILISDIAGYTRLVEADTEATVSAWREARDNCIKPEISKYDGSIVKLTGDGFLAEFSSVQNAVKCAIAMQMTLVENSLNFRMGVNLGDIIDDGQDIHGEGINIAARIEALATPGAVCITGLVHDSVHNQIDYHFEDLGQHQVKHVTQPVKVWQWTNSASKVAGNSQIKKEYKTDSLSLPDRPSVAVLPFSNLSNDPEQEHFADGMTEDLITDLSKVSGLFIVARHSSFEYKDKAIDIAKVGLELGVRYLLQGSVRKAAQRVRINAKLVEAENGNHVWADRYDGSLDDVFELQDEVSEKVVKALSITLSPKENEVLKKVHTQNLDAYELFVRARVTPYPPLPEKIKLAAGMFSQVIEMDPEFAGGYAGVSSMLSFGSMWGHSKEQKTVDQALELANKAISIDDTFAWSYTARATALLVTGRHDEALLAVEKGISLQPSDADAHAFYGFIQSNCGRYEGAIDSIDRAIRLNPQFYYGPYLNMRGHGNLLAGNYSAAVADFTENVERNGPFGPPAYCWFATALMANGQIEESQKMVEKITTQFPAFRISGWDFLDLIQHSEIRGKLVEMMIATGIPA